MKISFDTKVKIFYIIVAVIVYTIFVVKLVSFFKYSIAN